MSSIDYRSSHLGKSDDYHEIFESDPYTAMMWRLERREIDRFMRDFYPSRPPEHLDFACGTGRIVEHVRDRTASSVGVDVSDSMLSVARRRNPGLEFLRADLTRDERTLPGPFDLITAFRFFPNAEPALRDEAMSALTKRLQPAGYLVFNNHMNDDSLHRDALRLSRRTPEHGMSMAEVDGLLQRHGLRQVREHGLGLLPMTESWFRRAPRSIEAVETHLSGWRIARRKTQNILIVATPA